MLFGGGILIVILIMLIFWYSLWFYVIGLIIVGFGDGISMIVVNVYVVMVMIRFNWYVFNMFYLVFNVGVVIGILLVGYLLELGINVVFMVVIVCYFGFMVIMLSIFNVILIVWIEKVVL